MGRILLDVSISLDGIMAKSDSYRLHQWYFNESDENVAHIVKELIETTGAIIMGRNTFNLGHSFDGFINNQYQVPHIILTHTTPQFTPKGDTQFIYAKDGIEDAISKAKVVAGGKNIVVTGGVDTARQFLLGQYVDELQLHVVPVMLGEGKRLFEANHPVQQEWTCISLKQSSNAVHLKYRRKPTNK